MVPADQLDHAVGRITAQLTVNAPLSLLANKRTVRALLQSSPDMAAIDVAMNACFDSKDYAEGRKAFMEKRKPAFTGS